MEKELELEQIKEREVEQLKDRSSKQLLKEFPNIDQVKSLTHNNESSKKEREKADEDGTAREQAAVCFYYELGFDRIVLNRPLILV